MPQTERQERVLIPQAMFVYSIEQSSSAASRPEAPMEKRYFGKTPVWQQWWSDWRSRPADGWRRKYRPWLVGAAPVGLMVLLLTAVIAEGADDGQGPHAMLFHGLALVILLLALVGTAGVWVVTFRSLLTPLYHLRTWAARVRAGNLSVRIPASVTDGEFAKLAADVNSVSDILSNLSAERSSLPYRPMTARWLEILNDITAGIASSQDLDELLPRFLYTLWNANEIRAGMVRLATDDGHLRLMASIGLPDDIVAKERRIPLDCCLCGHAAGQVSLSVGFNIHSCCESWGQTPFAGEDLVLLAVPLRCEGRTVGIYNLFMQRTRIVGHNDVSDLLLGLGRHLGAAIEKMRLQDERRQLSLLQERMTIAHELHDSLAQTLAGLRIQAQVLRETLAQDEHPGVRSEFDRLSAGLEVAHREVRDLIRNWRAVGAEGGLLPALDATITRFQAETGIPVFVQKDWQGVLPASYQTHVLRVIQEALSNVRKHAHAQTVRVLLASEADGLYRVLIEDDGEGAVPGKERDDQEEHFGQAIMRERARAMGGELRVEREIGEGTQVLLTFRNPGATPSRTNYPVASS
ncbi:MAG: histidine kinase [Gammaproteobacteria bacterium]|nr:histidine kinase [Gammaproteobacteria bacterium]